MSWIEGTYTSDIQKYSSLIEEMSEILGYWEPGISLDALSEKIIQNGGLGRVSQVRINDLIMRAFKQRFLLPDESSAVTAKMIIDTYPTVAEVREYMFLVCLRTYLVLYDFLVERYWPAVFSGQETILGRQINTFIKDKSGQERNPSGWSDGVISRVGRNIGKMLTDFGFFYDTRSTVRRIRNFEASDFLVTVILYEAKEQEVGDTSKLDLPEWKALGMNRQDVIERCRRLGSSAANAFYFQYSGELAQFSWKFQTVEEFLRERNAA